MSETAKRTNLAILNVRIENDKIRAEISDGRIVLIPLSWFPRLASASPEDLHQCEISPSGYGVHWPRLDEDISVRSFVSEK